MVQAAMIRTVSWNDLPQTSPDDPRLLSGNETYSLVRIPGVQFSKAAWWSLSDVQECIFGAMHELLARMSQIEVVKRIE